MTSSIQHLTQALSHVKHATNDDRLRPSRKHLRDAGAREQREVLLAHLASCRAQLEAAIHAFNALHRECGR